jgi:type VI secretion system secreted protein Hcp
LSDGVYFTSIFVNDSSTTKLFQEACSGRNGKTAVIHLVTTGNPGDTHVAGDVPVQGLDVHPAPVRLVGGITLDSVDLQVNRHATGATAGAASPPVAPPPDVA